MRVAFVNASGGTMYVDESRVDEYKAAGYMLAADVIDSTAVIVDAEVDPEVDAEKPVKRRRKRG